MTNHSLPDRSKAPATGDFAPRSLPVPTDRLLDNGILRRCLHREDYELVRIDRVCPSGSMEFMPLVAVLHGRILKEGSRNYSGKQIAETLDYNGASVVAMPSNHHTVVSLTALRRNIHKVLQTFFDLLCHPVFPLKEMDAVKRQMITELQCNRETPAFNAREEMRGLLAGRSHRFAMTESAEGIRDINVEMLHSCHRACIDPQGITAYVAGFADAALITEIDSYLEEIKGCGPSALPQAGIFMPEAAGEYNVQVDGSLQHAVVAAAPVSVCNASDTGFWPLRLAIHALGGYFGSRLMQNIREDKGYTYGIYAQLNIMREGSFANISCECDPTYTAGVLSEINTEIRRFAAKPMDADEHHRLQLSLASRLAGMCDTPMKVQAQLVSQHINGQSPQYYDMFWEALQQTSPEQMSQAVGQYLPTNAMRTVIAGDFKK